MQTKLFSKFTTNKVVTEVVLAKPAPADQAATLREIARQLTGRAIERRTLGGPEAA